MKNIDGTKNTQVGADGRLLQNMTRRLDPLFDDNGEPFIMLRSRKEPYTQERRYLKVLVFEHHSTVAGAHRAKLGKEDVKLVDPDKGCHISNLQLTEAGLDKIENQGGFKAEEKSESEGHPPAPPSPNDSGHAKADKDEPDNEDEVEEKAEETAPDTTVLKAKPTTKGGSHYDLLDADGNNVLDSYNDGKKVNGQKNLDAIAEEHGVEIEVV